MDNDRTPAALRLSDQLGLETERAEFARWCRENGQGELDDMLTPLYRSLRALMWPVWLGAVAAERERCAALCEQWNTTPGSRLAREIRGEHPKPRVKTAAEMRYDAAHDTSCVGAFARARPGKA
jgi:hypothetical protein